MGIMRTARVVAAGAVGAVALGGCGLQLLGGSDGADGTDGDAREVQARSGAFTVAVPKDYRDIDITDQPETIEVAVQRADPEQIMLSRFEGEGVAEQEALHAVTGNVSQFGLDCQPLSDALGGDKAWSCTGADAGQPMEKVIITTDKGNQGAMVLVQGAEGDVQDLAQEIVGSIDWR